MFERIEKAEVEEEALRVAKLLKERFRYKHWTAVGLASGGLQWTGMVFNAMDTLDWKNRNMHPTMGQAKLYDGTEAGKEIRMSVQGSRHIFEDRAVVVFDDIVDSGMTRRKFAEVLVRNMGAKLVIWCPMLQKEKWQKGKGQEFVGIWIPDDTPFLVGMGMDYNSKYRDLDYIDTLETVQSRMNMAQAIIDRSEQVVTQKTAASRFGGFMKKLVGAKIEDEPKEETKH